MGKIAFLCPGQGSQAVGMGAGFLMTNPEYADVFETAKGASGVDVYDLCSMGAISELNETANAQACVATTSVVTAMALREKGIEPDCIAGVGCGEYAAHIIAGTIDLETGMMVLGRRAAMMSLAGFRSPGRVARLEGCSAERAQELCQRHAAEGVLAIAMYEGAGHIVISGEQGAVEAACADWQGCGEACTMLPLFLGVNSPLMEQARAGLMPALKATLFGASPIPLYCNCNAQPYKPTELVEDLAAQVVEPIQWEQTVRAMLEAGVDTFYECGPGRTLGASVRGIASEEGIKISFHSITDPKDLENL